MKYPRHRATCYLVERVLYYENGDSFSTVGVFASPEGADEFKEACEQEFVDKGIDKKHWEFNVVSSTYYDT